MRRIVTSPRIDWKSTLSHYPYVRTAASAAKGWDESVYYTFSANQIDMIEEVADETHKLIQDATHYVITNRLLPLIGINPETARMISSSWSTSNDHNYNQGHEHTGLFGRLDFAYDGLNSLKLIGACYDGPCGLFSSSIVQWAWLIACFPDADQFNSLHEGLVECWQNLSSQRRNRGTIYFTAANPDTFREGELAYLAATAEEARLQTATLAIQDIGWDGTNFVDLDGQKITWLLKLYPWEAMVVEEFGSYLLQANISVLDPLWRMPASNHGLLAILWELYPQHPCLCRASLTDLEGSTEILKRSFFGVEYPEEKIVRSGCVVAETGRVNNNNGYVSIVRPPTFHQDGTEAILNVWIIGNKCLGMTVRESRGLPIGWANSLIVPHLFTK